MKTNSSFQFALSILVHSSIHPPPMQSHTIKCDLNALKDSPCDIKNINLLAGTPASPAPMFIHLGLESLAKAMAPKIAAARYLGPSPTTEAVKRPELGFKSIAWGIVKGGQHGITSPLLMPERRVEELMPVEVRGPGSARRVREDPGGAFLVVSANTATAPGAMKPFSEMIAR
jgi:hypothetical protein